MINTSKNYEMAEDKTHSIANESCTANEMAEEIHEWAENEVQFRRKVWKNVLLLSVTFCLGFTAYGGLCNIQSSLFIDQGLGVVCQSITYVTYALSALFLPKLTIRSIGYKWSIGGCLIGYTLWMAANGYATWGTMVPASMIVGVCAGPLWTAHGACITTLAKQYANHSGKSVRDVMPLFFGVSLGIYKLSTLFGSLISWSVLQNTWINSSNSIHDEDIEQCGPRDCPSANSTNVYFEKPPSTLLWILVGIFIATAISSIFLTVFGMDSIPKAWYKSGKVRTPKEEIRYSVTAAIRLHRDYRQLLLIPVSMYPGISMSFIMADFNKSYVTCSLGVWMVGLVLIPSTLSNVGTSVLSGYIGKRAGWLPLLTSCAS